jgi:hypothetical protein
MLAFAGEMEMDERVGAGGVVAVTVRVVVALTPLYEAAIVADPAAPPVARPEALMVAVAAAELVHVADVVTTAAELSLYTAVAVNCWVAPTAMLVLPGESAIELSVLDGLAGPGEPEPEVLVPAVARDPHPVAERTNETTSAKRQSDSIQSRRRG